MKYLYGASVQGIQEFIFTTNKLKEIVGASEIVKSISEEIKKYKPDDILVNAAGNIKAVFNDEEKIKKVVLEFPKLIIQKAYGITISQAVVTFKGDYPSKEDFNKLEAKLKTQRNLQNPPLDLSLNIMMLSPSTAKPVVQRVKIQDKSTPIDKATKQKRDANNKNEEYNDISKLSNSNNKIAIIHADGNGLGKLIPTLEKKLSEFSKNLDTATNKAFELAQTEDMKIRKVILGGDDMTIICDADSALEFTKNYLINFEKQTQELTGHKLTACAGITYCNERYPFHYAVMLAEELCSTSKDASNRESSCLLFHNIQSSNVESYEKFIEDELTIGDISLNYGPYYTDAAKGTSLIHFQNLVNALALKNSPISSLRQWIGELNFNKDYAQNMIERIDEMADLQPNYNKDILNKNFKALDENLSLRNPIANNKTPIYDVLQILSVTKGAK
jgi:hypothetical protein